jgi:3-hydroxy-9,10-secoandrosta-1,3,5(10)-triene-9,17-dione monooxygenase
MSDSIAIHTSPAATEVTADELFRRARAMIPALRARAARTVAERCVPAETIAEFAEAGFFRILQPRRWGGYEMEPNVFYDVQKIVAQGCMSSGWVLGVVGGHAFQISLFPVQAQEDVWGKDDTILASSSYQPVGKVERAEGGYYISGHWGFSSGCDHCQWVLLGAVIPPETEGGAPDMRTFLVPRSDYEIVDGWNVFGLQGTGSQDIVVKRAFVPEHRTHKSSDGFNCANPGQALNSSPLYRLPWAQVFLRLVSTSAFGGARAALEAAEAIMADRVSTNTGKASKDNAQLINAVARAYSQLDEMEAVLRRNMNDMLATVTTGGEITLQARAIYRHQSASVAVRCAALIDELMPMLGGRAIYMSSPIIQPWLDLLAARAHVANDPNNFGADLLATKAGGQPAFRFM